MDKSILKEGFQIIFENSKSLFNAAEILEKQKQYAIANSLLILSAEEAIKAINVLTQYFQEETVDNEFNKSFTHHKTKLEAIRNSVFFIKITEKFNELIYEPIIQNLNDPKEEQSIVRKRSFENLINWLESLPQSKKSEISAQNDWWLQANSKKQDGFYVGKQQNKWQLPSKIINSKKYFETKKYVSTLLMPIEMLYKMDFEILSKTLLKARKKAKHSIRRSRAEESKLEIK